jgi:hypothetical protein
MAVELQDEIGELEDAATEPESPPNSRPPTAHGMAQFDRHLDFERSAKERGALFFGCLLLGLGCWWLLTHLEPLLLQQADQQLRVARFAFRDLMYSCIAVCSLICLWACFRPQWLERMLEHAASHLRFAFCCVIGFLFILCPVVTLVIELWLR